MSFETQKPSLSPRRILLVDDDEDILEIMSDCLRNLGEELITARNGIEALEKCVDGSVQVVVTDLLMPEMGGLELLAALRKHKFAMPVIILTGHEEPGLVHEASKYGAFAIIEKLRATQILAEKVEKALDQAL